MSRVSSRADGLDVEIRHLVPLLDASTESLPPPKDGCAELKSRRPALFYSMLIAVLVAVQCSFSGYHIIAKLALNSDANALIFSFYRDLVCTPLMFIISWLLEGFPVVQWSDAPRIIFLGATGVFGNQVLFIYGLQKTNPTNAAIMQPLIPVLTAAVALLMGLEQLHIYHWFGVLRLIGLVCGLVGAAYMLGLDNLGGQGADAITGNICLLIQSLSLSLYMIAQRPLLKVYPGTRITFWSYLCGTVFLGLSSFYYVGDADAFAIKHDNYWYALAYAAVVSSCAAYLLITWANSQTSSVIVTSFWPLQVFFSALFSFFVFAEEFQLRQGVGAAIIIAGLFAVCYTQLKISEFEASLPQLHLNKASEGGQ